jgi:NAD(P)-dependent dehydrogenase (short-subunit alcohol dehydrogenase family)
MARRTVARRWLISGCSTGLGRALAEAACAYGDSVVATARDLSTLDRLVAAYPDYAIPCRLDVREAADCEAAVKLAVDRLGGVDVLVNNAGYAQFGAVEEVSDEELQAQFATNLFGAWRMTRLVLPIMRAQRRGDVLVVSSVAGRMAFAGLGAYTATKYALEGMVETLAVELAGTGITVTALEPGGFATRYGASVVEPAARVPHYTQVVQPMLDGVRRLVDAPTAGQPELFAATVLRLVEQHTRPVRLPIGQDAWRLILDAGERDRAQLLHARRMAGSPPLPAGATMTDMPHR